MAKAKVKDKAKAKGGVRSAVSRLRDWFELRDIVTDLSGFIVDILLALYL